jgi:ACS family glucarate transporter-like MFS transporter
METTRDVPEPTFTQASPGPKAPIIPLRYLILSMLFFITTINNADRATTSVTGADLSKFLHMDKVDLGYLRSAIGWSYVLAQLPGGWLLDRFGSYKVYAWCIALWSIFTLLQGFVGYFNVTTAIVILFTLRLLVGFAEGPSFPANGRIVASWFPTKERGTASAIFNSAQYFATAIFIPIMAALVKVLDWRYVFWFMGGLGLVILWPWLKLVRPPKNHPRITAEELGSIERGGALVSMDDQVKGKPAKTFQWSTLKALLSSRMLLGVYIGQYCIATITAFFLSWFYDYLRENRGMSFLQAGFVAVLPALCGFAGGVLGGVISDFLLRRGHSLTFARKFPIVAGMALSCVIITCNYVDKERDWLIIVFMCLAFFGKGIGAMGWTVVSDTSPKHVMGMCGSLFNTFGNISTITTPIAIGYIIKYTGGFNGALVFVGAHALGAILSYLLVVGEIKRLELKPTGNPIS